MRRVFFHGPPRGALAVARHVAHLVASDAATTAVPELQVLPLLTIRDLQPSRSFKVITSVTCGLHPCHFLFRCDEALSGSCQLRKATETSGDMPGAQRFLHRRFIYTALFRVRAKACREFVQLPTRHRCGPCDVCKVPEAGQRSTRCGSWLPGASTLLAQEVTISLCSRISKSVCEMVSHSQLWIQASTLRFPLGFFRFSPVTSLAPAGSKFGRGGQPGDRCRLCFCRELCCPSASRTTPLRTRASSACRRSARKQ